jgi:tRNA 2-thiouridine synthesizing protein C
MSKYLFIISDPPFTNQATEEALELAIGFAAMDANISILFLGAACLQLKNNLNPILTGFNKKSIGIITSLNSYSIDHIYTIQEDLDKFKLNDSNITIEHLIIRKSALLNLYLAHDFILHNSTRK